MEFVISLTIKIQLISCRLGLNITSIEFLMLLKIISGGLYSNSISMSKKCLICIFYHGFAQSFSIGFLILMVVLVNNLSVCFLKIIFCKMTVSNT